MGRFETGRCGLFILATGLLATTLTCGFATGAAAQCVGDCDGDGKVRISEAQRCINIKTGAQALSACQNADQNLDGTVSEGEVEACLQSFLDEANCPAVFTPPPTNTPSSTPTATPTFTATETATMTPTPEATSTPTSTATNTPTSTDTPTSTPLPTATPTDTPTITPTPEVTPIGSVTLTLGDGSKANLQTAVTILPVDLTGSLVLNIGAPDANGVAIVDVPKDTAVLPPVDLGFAIACVSMPKDASGILDCDGGSPDLNVAYRQDHNTTPGSGGNSGSAAGLPDDPECNDETVLPTGATSTACMEKTPGSSCADGRHANVCNSPLYATTSGTFRAGDMRLNLTLRITTSSAAGPDKVFCTADDVPLSDPTVAEMTMTTGTVTLEIIDANNTKNSRIAPNATCPAPKPCVAGNTGVPFSCANLANKIVTGANIGGAFPSLDFTLGDTVISVAFVGQ